MLKRVATGLGAAPARAQGRTRMTRLGADPKALDERIVHLDTDLILGEVAFLDRPGIS